MKHIVKSKGAVLIMTMMAVSLLFMMVSALMQTTGIGLNSSTNFYDREAALQAAQSGLDYAVTMMQTNRAWRGDSNREYWKFRNGSSTGERGSLADKIFIKENNGNVVGLLVNQGNNISGFRIKFSYETDDKETLKKLPSSTFAEGTEAEPLPSTAFKIASPYVSVNNLRNKDEVLVYRANTDGVGIAEKVSNMEYGMAGDMNVYRDYSHHLPGERACIIVEGLSGAALRDCDSPEKLNAIANGTDKAHRNLALCRRYVEAYYTKNAPVLSGQAALADGDISFTLPNKGKLFVRSNDFNRANAHDKSTVPAPGYMRSNSGTINVPSPGVLNTYSGTLYTADGKATFTPDNDKYKFKDEKNKDKWYSFKNTAIEQVTDNLDIVAPDTVALAQKGTDYDLLPGTYQWYAIKGSNENDPPTYELRYFEPGISFIDDCDGYKPASADADRYKIVVEANADGSVPVAEQGEGEGAAGHEYIAVAPYGKLKFTRNGDGKISVPTMKLFGELHCNGDLMICSDLDSVENTIPRIEIGGFNKATLGKKADMEEGVLTANGNITCVSTVSGSGAITTTSNGDVTLVGESAINSGSSGVAIYANNITIESLEKVAKRPPGKDNWQREEESDDQGYPAQKEGENYSVQIDSEKLYNAATSSMPWIAIGELLQSYGINCQVSSERKLANYEGYIKLEVQLIDSNGRKVGEERKLFVSCARCNDSFNYWTDEGHRQSAGQSSFRFVFDAKAFLGTTNPAADDSQLNQYSSTIGKISSGDQLLTGVIYARDKFKANLGDHKLIVKGAIRAEQGKIDVTCNSAELCYDESALDKLMPSFSAMTCYMWNCW